MAMPRGKKKSSNPKVAPLTSPGAEKGKKTAGVDRRPKGFGRQGGMPQGRGLRKV
jgi:hypothetical protein